MELRDMGLAEVRNLVKWIDEQQRKGRQEAATLQQQFANQRLEMSEMVQRIKELEGQLPNFQTQIARISQVDDQMNQLKAEIVHLIEQSEDRRVQAEKEIERLRQVDQNSQLRTMTEMREQLAPLPRLVEEMGQRRAEDERLSALIATIQNQLPPIETRLEERVRDLTFLEEAQRQDARRIAELQQSLIEGHKRDDTFQSKLLILEDAIRRNETKLDQIQQAEIKRQQQVEHFMEQGRLADQRRKQELVRWAEKLDEFEELMAGYAKQWRLFEDQHRLSKETTAGLQELKDRLERRQDEMGELQRVENERIKQQWVEFLSDDQKREKQRQLEDEQWVKEQKRQRDSYLELFQELQDQVDRTGSDIKSLFILQEKYADSFRQITRIWLEGYESVVSPPVTRKVPG